MRVLNYIGRIETLRDYDESVDVDYPVTDLSVWESVPLPPALRVSSVSEIQVPIWLDAIIVVEPLGILYLICNSKSFKRLFTIL